MKSIDEIIQTRPLAHNKRPESPAKKKKLSRKIHIFTQAITQANASTTPKDNVNEFWNIETAKLRPNQDLSVVQSCPESNRTPSVCN